MKAVRVARANVRVGRLNVRPSATATRIVTRGLTCESCRAQRSMARFLEDK